MTSEIRFCTAADGTRLAYGLDGSGPPLVRVATWLTHLDRDRESPVWRHWLQQFGTRHTLLRYDERGCGLSDTEIGEPSVETWVGDLQTVIDAAGLERCALLGVSQGAAIAVAYAARFPERVTDLVLYGGYARGRRLRGQTSQDEALLAAIRAGWTEEDSAYRHLFSMLFLPRGSPQQMVWYDDLLRTTTSADTAVRLFQARGGVDVVDAARGVRTRTLVIHARDDRVVPAAQGRLLATLIPGARLVLVDSCNHILLADEPAWASFVSAVSDFLGWDQLPTPRSATSLAPLSARELEIVELVAEGLTNEVIAERLCLSTRTVERHLSNLYAKLRVSGKAARAAAAASFAGRRRAG